MKPTLDKNRKLITPGARVEIKFCVGRYGITETLTGTIDEKGVDQYGGAWVIVDKPCSENAGRFGMQYYNAGDRRYICLPHHYDFEIDARVCDKTVDDFEHGHTAYVEIIG